MGEGGSLWAKTDRAVPPPSPGEHPHEIQRPQFHPSDASDSSNENVSGNRHSVTPLRDLASKYQVPTPLVAPEENGEPIALYLDRMFKQEGPPMFLKRDLGSPLNCAAQDEGGMAAIMGVTPRKLAYCYAAA